MAVAYAEFAAEAVRDWRLFSFPTRNRKNALLCFVAVKVVKLAHAIARVLKGKEVRAGRRTTFGMGVAIPFVVLLPACRRRAPTALSCGGCNRGVVAASSIPQGIRGSNHGHSCLVVSGAYCLLHRRC